MKLLNKILKKSTKTSKKSEGQCDQCQITIWEGDRAVCFHTDDQEVYLCESCIEKIYGEYVKEEYK
jgi:hypothetical protein